jgi:hypothetical protein
MYARKYLGLAMMRSAEEKLLAITCRTPDITRRTKKGPREVSGHAPASFGL